MFEVYVEGLDRLEARLLRMEQAVARAPMRLAEDTARSVLDQERREAPRRTGALAEGLAYRVTGGVSSAEVRFSSRASYTPFVVHGTAPHEIASARGRALFWPGAGHPVAFVQHPGTKPDDFPDRALEQARHGIGPILDVVGREILEGV
jgi:hypothetical protein